jgi:polygalacturonase
MARLKENVILMTKEKEEEKEEEGDQQAIDSSDKNYQMVQQQQQQQREGMMRTWSQRRVNMGLFDPPTPRTLNHKRQRNVLITNVRIKNSPHVIILFNLKNCLLFCNLFSICFP